MALNREENTQETSIINGVLGMLQSTKTWQGTMTQLSSAIKKNLNAKEAKNITTSPSSLRMTINRIINRLRSRGISITFGRDLDRNRTRFVKLVFSK